MPQSEIIGEDSPRLYISALTSIYCTAYGSHTASHKTNSACHSCVMYLLSASLLISRLSHTVTVESRVCSLCVQPRFFQCGCTHHASSYAHPALTEHPMTDKLVACDCHSYFILSRPPTCRISLRVALLGCDARRLPAAPGEPLRSI